MEPDNKALITAAREVEGDLSAMSHIADAAEFLDRTVPRWIEKLQIGIAGAEGRPFSAHASAGAAAISNFLSGKALPAGDRGPLRYEDAAKKVTVEGWSCIRCGAYYGDGEGAERAARYCCHTDAPCETQGCPNRKERHRIYCPTCYATRLEARWRALAQVDSPQAPSPQCPLAQLDGDHYFFDEDSLYEHCERHEVKPSQLYLVLCEPHNPPPFDLAEFLHDYLPGEDHEMVGEDSDVRAIERLVNAFVERHSPISWMPDYAKRPSDASIAAMDAECARGAP